MKVIVTKEDVRQLLAQTNPCMGEAEIEFSPAYNAPFVASGNTQKDECKQFCRFARMANEAGILSPILLNTGDGEPKFNKILIIMKLRARFKFLGLADAKQCMQYIIRETDALPF